MREKEYAVYAMTNKTRSTIYVGVTSNLAERVLQHKEKINPKSFTAKYNLDRLIYYELFDEIGLAILWEKEIKGWTREKKEHLIRSKNPDLKDLSDDIL